MSLRPSPRRHLPGVLLALGTILCLAGAALFLCFVPGATSDVAVSVAGGMGVVASIAFSVGGLLIAFAFGTRPPRAATATPVSKGEGVAPLADETWASLRDAFPRPRSTLAGDLAAGLVAAAALIETLRAGDHVTAGGGFLANGWPALALWGLVVIVLLMSRRRSRARRSPRPSSR